MTGAQWELGPGRQDARDPWQSTRFVHLIDPQTAEAFTFSTSSCRRPRLRRSILPTRSSACAASTPTRCRWSSSAPHRCRPSTGSKSKPTLKVVGWRTTDDELRWCCRGVSFRHPRRSRKWTTIFPGEVPSRPRQCGRFFFRCHHVRLQPQPRCRARARRCRREDISRRRRQAPAVQRMAGDRHHRERHHCRLVAPRALRAAGDSLRRQRSRW